MSPARTLRYRVHKSETIDRYGDPGTRRARYMVVDVMTNALADDDVHSNRKIAAGVAADYNRAWHAAGRPDATQPFELPY